MVATNSVPFATLIALIKKHYIGVSRSLNVRMENKYNKKKRCSLILGKRKRCDSMVNSSDYGHVEKKRKIENDPASVQKLHTPSKGFKRKSLHNDIPYSNDVKKRKLDHFKIPMHPAPRRRIKQKRIVPNRIEVAALKRQQHLAHMERIFTYNQRIRAAYLRLNDSNTTYWKTIPAKYMKKW